MQAVQPDKKQKISPTFLVFLLGALIAIGPLSIDMYLPAFEQIATGLGVTIDQVQLTIASYFLGMAGGQLFYGPLTDRFGRKNPLLIGMIIFAVASLGCTIATNIEMLLVFRVMQAVGGGAGMVVTRAIARDLFDKKQVADFFSNMTLVIVLAPIFAPIMGTYINDLFGWRAIFAFLFIFSLFCIASLILFLPETNEEPHDSIGIFKILKNYYALIKDLSFIQYLGPDSAVRSGLFAYITTASFVFITQFGLTPENFSLVFGINGVGIMIASQINRLLLKRYEAEQIFAKVVIAVAVFGTGIFIAGYLLHSLYLFMLALFLFVSCLPFSGANSMACALEHQGKQAGTASSLYGFAQWCVAALSSTVVSLVHDGTMLPMTVVLMVSGLSAPLLYYSIQMIRKKAS